MLIQYAASVWESLCRASLLEFNEMNLVVSILMAPFKHWNRNISLAIFALFAMVSNSVLFSSSVGESVWLKLLNTKQIIFHCTPSSRDISFLVCGNHATIPCSGIGWINVVLATGFVLGGASRSHCLRTRNSLFRADDVMFLCGLQTWDRVIVSVEGICNLSLLWF